MKLSIFLTNLLFGFFSYYLFTVTQIVIFVVFGVDFKERMCLVCEWLGNTVGKTDEEEVAGFEGKRRWVRE